MKDNKNSRKTHFKGYLLPGNVLSASIIGIFAALICVLTMIISIPVPATQGFINIGDAGVMISGLLFGPIVGGLSGGIGSALADIFLGYTIYAPGTLIIKGLEGFVVGLIANPKRYYKKLNYRDILAVVVGGAIMAFGYFFYEIILFGIQAAFYEIILNGIIQFGLGGLLAILFIVSARKSIVDSLSQVFDKIFINLNITLEKHLPENLEVDENQENK